MKPLALVLLLAPAFAAAQDSNPSLPPALYVRSATGPAGYAPDLLAKDMDYTSHNLSSLVFYLEPFKKDQTPAQGKDAAWAQKTLVDESAAADKLIEAGEQVLAKGAQRKKIDVPPFLGKAAWATLARRKDAPIEAFQRNVALAQANLLQDMSALIQSRSLEYKGYAEAEAEFEKWIENSRKSLDAARKRLAEAQSNAPYGDKK